MNRFKIITGFVLSLMMILLISSCHKKENKEEQTATVITDTIAKKIVIDTVKTRRVMDELKLNGKVTFVEDQVAKVFPMVSGRATEVKVSMGDYVEKGQVLAIISSTEVAGFEQQFITAQSQQLIAQKNKQAAEDMHKAGLVNDRELITAQKELENAEAEVNRVKEVLKINNVGGQSQYIIKAPISGFVVDKKINVGMDIRTDDNDAIFTVSNLDYVWVIADVYENDISLVKEGYPVEVTTLSYPNKVYNGKIDKILNVLDPLSKVMKVRIVLKNPDFMLKPEMFARVKVTFIEEQEVNTIPAKAIIFDHSKNYVMVYTDKTHIETRETKVIKTINGIAYVDNLKAGERVISKYNLLIYDALND